MGDVIDFQSSTTSRTIQLPETRKGLRPMMQEFHSSISEDRVPRMSGEEGLKALAIVLAAYKSAEEGGEARLNPI